MNIIMNGKIQNNRNKKSFSRGTDPSFIKTQRGAASSIRITSGEFRGRALISPRQAATHPMGSRERLALFNAIGPHIKNKVVLDVFAGTGALGLEALSRGASHVTFIEKNHKAAATIRDNIKMLKCEDRARVFECDVKTIDFDRPYNIVIADPPYEIYRQPLIDNGRTDEIVNLLNRLARTASELFVLSHAPEFDPHVINAELLATRSYAGARISMYKGNPLPQLIPAKENEKLDAPDQATVLGSGEEVKQLDTPEETKKLEAKTEPKKLEAKKPEPKLKPFEIPKLGL